MTDEELRHAIDTLDTNESLRYQANEQMRHRLSVNGIRQNAIAETLDISPAYVCDWIHGRRELPPKRLRTLYEQFIRGSGHER